MALHIFRRSNAAILKQIEITDNGTGMDSETLDKIFTLFFSSKGKKGTGLGLFITERIIRQHNGKIEVKSTPGHGTRFRVLIPTHPLPPSA